MEDELSHTKGDQDMTVEQQEHERSDAALLAENDMLEHFISRLDPQAVGEAVSAEAGGHGSDGVQQLTLSQKLYVAQTEITEIRREQEKLRQTYKKIQESYKSSMKEAKLCLSEIRKAKTDFERTCMKDNKLEMKNPDKILQYIEDKSKFSLLVKCSMKNQMLKVQEKKLKQQLELKTEVARGENEETESEVLQDYDEQRIEKNLNALQVSSFKVQHNLNSHKEKLQSVEQESTELCNEITRRKLMLAKIEDDLQDAEKKRLKAQALNQHLHRQMADYQAPDITDYIHVKDKHKKLQQSVHIWERKVSIAEMALKSHTKACYTQCYTFTPANSAAAGARSANPHMPVRLPNIREENI